MRLPLPLVALNAAVLAAGVLVTASVSDSGPAPRPVAQPQLSPTASPTGPAAAALPSPAPLPTAGPSPVPAPTSEPSPTSDAPASDAPASVRVPTAQAPARQPTPGPAPQQVPAQQRTVTRTGYGPYATVGPVTLHFPGAVVEVVGLHQSGHDGAQPQSPVASGARTGRLQSRSRGTDPQGAADIVVDPTQPIRSPVTGRVLRADSYTLYCDYVDQYLVVEPDARPGWEVKLLHFEGLRVAPGDRVVAGQTVVGSRARALPFASQVDKHTAAPHWPHVHLEVVDTAVEDRPSGGGCD